MLASRYQSGPKHTQISVSSTKSTTFPHNLQQSTHPWAFYCRDRADMEWVLRSTHLSLHRWTRRLWCSTRSASNRRQMKKSPIGSKTFSLTCLMCPTHLLSLFWHQLARTLQALSNIDLHSFAPLNLEQARQITNVASLYHRYCPSSRGNARGDPFLGDNSRGAYTCPKARCPKHDNDITLTTSIVLSRRANGETVWRTELTPKIETLQPGSQSSIVSLGWCSSIINDFIGYRDTSAVWQGSNQILQIPGGHAMS
jgi:hypothetical protein